MYIIAHRHANRLDIDGFWQFESKLNVMQIKQKSTRLGSLILYSVIFEFELHVSDALECAVCNLLLFLKIDTSLSEHVV